MAWCAVKNCTGTNLPLPYLTFSNVVTYFPNARNYGKSGEFSERILNPE